MGMCLPMTWSAMSWTVAEDLFFGVFAPFAIRTPYFSFTFMCFVVGFP